MNKFFIERQILNPESCPSAWVAGWHGWLATADGNNTFEVSITIKVNGIYMVSLKSHEIDLGMHPKQETVVTEVTSWFTNTKDISEWISSVLLIDVTLVNEENNDF
jgi:hypothetical protein